MIVERALHERQRLRPLVCGVQPKGTRHVAHGHDVAEEYCLHILQSLAGIAVQQNLAEIIMDRAIIVDDQNAWVVDEVQGSTRGRLVGV